MVERARAAVERLVAAGATTEAEQWVAMLERLGELDEAALEAAALDDRSLLFLGSDQH